MSNPPTMLIRGLLTLLPVVGQSANCAPVLGRSPLHVIYSGGCWSWYPWVALEQSAQGSQGIDAVLARGRDVGAHGQERLRAVHGPPAPGDLLLQLDHADVALRQIVCGWDPQIFQEPAGLIAVDLQPLQQASGR